MHPGMPLHPAMMAGPSFGGGAGLKEEEDGMGVRASVEEKTNLPVFIPRPKRPLTEKEMERQLEESRQVCLSLCSWRNDGKKRERGSERKEAAAGLKEMRTITDYRAASCANGRGTYQLTRIHGTFMRTNAPACFFQSWERGDYCELCGGMEEEPNILLCDGCDGGFHTYCLTPPLERIPAGDWMCPSCVAKVCVLAFRLG